MKDDLKIVQDESAPVTTEVLAKSIVALAEAAKRLTQSGLSERATVLLLQDMTSVSGARGTTTSIPKSHIYKVLRALPELANVYVVKAPDKVAKKK